MHDSLNLFSALHYLRFSVPFATRPERSERVTALCAAALVCSASWSAQAQSLVDYRVQAGDTCPAIAQRLYGDVGRIDLIHQNNNLGRLPHRLRVGQVLRVPQSATGPRPNTSDARVTFVRNQVNAFTPEEHPASRDEGLARGHRVGTLEASSAELTFIDETQLQLASNTLIIVLGRTAQRTDAGSIAETRLERGTLRSSLAALSGATAPSGPARTLTVQTPSGTATVGAGSSLVDVDQRRTTRLAVHQGQAALAVGRRSVQVQEGFGSRADRGRPPTPPQRLPDAPVWSHPMAPLSLLWNEERGQIQGTYARGPNGPAPVVWHVQLARDARFNDLIVDSRIPVEVVNLDAQLTAGQYFARIAAVDADGFEGRPSAVQQFRVATARLDPGGPGRRASITITPNTFCALDDDALAQTTATPLVITPLRTRRLRCAASAEGDGLVEHLFAPAEQGPVIIENRVADEEFAGTNGQRTLLLRVLNAEGAGIAGLRWRATVTGSTIGLDRVRETQTPGVYQVNARWNGSSARETVAFYLNQETDARATAVIEATTAPEVIPPPAAPPPPHVGLELAFSGDMYATLDPRFRSGLGMGLEARARIPAGPGLLLGMRASYERFGCVGPAAMTVTDFCGVTTAANINGPRTQVGLDVFTVGPLVGGYFARYDRPVTGYFSFVPLWLYHRSTVTRPDGVAQEAGSTFAVLAMLGAQLRIGPGGMFIQAGWRNSTANTQALGSLPIGGVAFDIGYRALF